MSDRHGYDLHTHSVHSDGTTTPTEIAVEAASLGLEGFALTDHDTIVGWDEARAAASAAGLDFLPGIEITTRHAGRSRHLLGYGVRAGSPELATALAEVVASRVGRARRMVERLSADYDVTWAEVLGEDETRTVGRPHIADAMVSKGFFASRAQVFDEVLHPASPYYEPTYAIDTVDAIGLVRAAGGVAVQAHPAAKRMKAPVSREELAEYVAAGLWGIELDHPENRPEWVPALASATEELGLVVTGASDYHGAGKVNRLGERRSDASVVEAIRAAVATPR